jgi:hypothetical protein
MASEMAKREAPAGEAGGTLHSRGNGKRTPGMPRARRRYGWYSDSALAYPCYRRTVSSWAPAWEARVAGRRLLERYAGDLEAALGVLELRRDRWSS